MRTLVGCGQGSGRHADHGTQATTSTACIGSGTARLLLPALNLSSLPASCPCRPGVTISACAPTSRTTRRRWWASLRTAAWCCARCPSALARRA